MRTIPALAAGLGVEVTGRARTLVHAGARGCPLEVHAVPFLDTAFTTSGFFLRARAGTGWTHRPIVRGGAGEGTHDDLTVFEDRHTLLEVLTEHLEVRVHVGVTERLTEVAGTEGRRTVDAPEDTEDDVGLEVVIGLFQHDAGWTERATGVVLHVVSRPGMDIGSLAVLARRVAELRTAAVFRVGSNESIRLSSMPAVTVTTRAGAFRILVRLGDEALGAGGVADVAVDEGELHGTAVVTVARDRLAEGVDRAVLEPPLHHRVGHDDDLISVFREVEDHARLDRGVADVVDVGNRVGLHDDVVDVGAGRSENPVPFEVERVAGAREHGMSRREVLLHVRLERLVDDEVVLRIVFALAGVDRQRRRPVVRERGRIDGDAIDFDLHVNVITAGVSGGATEAERMKPIHPLTFRDEHLLLTEMEDLAHDVGRVADEDIVARTAATAVVTLLAVGTRLLDDARGDGEDDVVALVIRNIPIPALVVVVGATDHVLLEVAAEVFDLALLAVEVEERGRAELALLLRPVLVERIGEGDVEVGQTEGRRDEEAAAQHDHDQREQQRVRLLDRDAALDEARVHGVLLVV